MLGECSGTNKGSPTCTAPLRSTSTEGGKTLLVAVHTRRASDWPETAAALSKVDRTQYDLKLVDAEHHKTALQDLYVQTIPMVIVVCDGREVTRWPNPTSFDHDDDELP